jgi:ribosomal protein S18 acetylase RimI-like enzyme
MPSYFIRKAVPADTRGIHDAHMQSIREVCAREHTPEEIAAWGGRAYDEAWRLKNIAEHLVWVVVSRSSEIFGFADFEIVADAKTQEKFGYLHALYFRPEAIGHGLGKKMLAEMFSVAREQGLRKIGLNSTLNSQDFYRKFGFQDTSPMITKTINGVGVRCIPMELIISTADGVMK